MTKKEIVLDCLIDDDECFTQIIEYFNYSDAPIDSEELQNILNEMLSEQLITINKTWQNEHNEFPYSLTSRGREIWKMIED